MNFYEDNPDSKLLKVTVNTSNTYSGKDDDEDRRRVRVARLGHTLVRRQDVGGQHPQHERPLPHRERGHLAGPPEEHLAHQLHVLPRGGRVRARSHCRFVQPLNHFIPDSLTYSVPLFLKRQCDRTAGRSRPWRSRRFRANGVWRRRAETLCCPARVMATG